MIEWLKMMIAWMTPRVREARELTVKACGFLPTVKTVVDLYGLGDPRVSTAVGIASTVCGIVTKTREVSTLTGDVTVKPEFEGVVIDGDYVNK